MSTNYVAAIKAKMGDWTYYITKMKFGEVATQVKLAEEIHKNKELDDVIQRDLSDRVEAMTKFLLEEPQRFYGSLVVSIYKGNPRFHPLKIDEGNKIIDSVNHSFGLLEMDGSQTYFALDGQHRLSSIKQACDNDPNLKSEEISVLVIKHEDTEAGLIRTRRLFTKLNRYAKPTDHKTNIAIDEDDLIAISTRRLVREFLPLKGLIKIDAAGKQLSAGKSDAKYMTTLAMLYECNREISAGFKYDEIFLELDKSFLSKRPDDDLLDVHYEFMQEVWASLFKRVPHLKSVAATVSTPGALRSDLNSAWMKPVSQLIIARVIRNALLAGDSVDKLTERVLCIPVSLHEEPWIDVIYDSKLKSIKSGSAHSEFLTVLLSMALGIETGETKTDVRKKYGEYFGKSSKNIPSYYGLE